jgi:hypothetical protein
MTPDADSPTAVRQPVNPHTDVIIGPEKRLATVCVNVHPPAIHFGGLRARRRLWLCMLNGVCLHPRRLDFLMRFSANLRLWFSANFRLRFRTNRRLRCVIHLRLRAGRGKLHRRAAVVSVKAAPVGSVEVRTKRANGQQGA